MIIQLIGARRAAILGALIATNVILAGLFFFVLSPMQTNAQAQLSGSQNEISGFQQKIEGVKRDMEIYKQNLPIYQGLQATGFLMNQDRFEMGRMLGDVREKSGISGFAYTINDLRVLPSTDATTVQMKLLASRIEISKMAVITDHDLFRFIDTMETNFPAQLRLNGFSIKRAGKLLPQTLGDISANRAVSLVTAEVYFDWMTLVPDGDQKGQATPGGSMNGGAR